MLTINSLQQRYEGGTMYLHFIEEETESSGD